MKLFSKIKIKTIPIRRFHFDWGYRWNGGATYRYITLGFIHIRKYDR